MGIAAVSRHPLGARRHTSDHGTRRSLRSSVTATVADVGVPGAASSQAGSRVRVRGNRAASARSATSARSVAASPASSASEHAPDRGLQLAVPAVDDTAAHQDQILAPRVRAIEIDQLGLALTARLPARVGRLVADGHLVALHGESERLHAVREQRRRAPPSLHAVGAAATPQLDLERPPTGSRRGPEPGHQKLRRAVARGRPAMELRDAVVGDRREPRDVPIAAAPVYPHGATRRRAGQREHPDGERSCPGARAEAVHAEARAAPGRHEGVEPLLDERGRGEGLPGPEVLDDLVVGQREQRREGGVQVRGGRLARRGEDASQLLDARQPVSRTAVGGRA